MSDIISIVVPVYGCANALYELYERVKATFLEIDKDFELILVNDSSPDNSWEIIEQIALLDKRVKAFSLSRNFGQHKAVTAGLFYASGDYCVIMDCDLQDKPEDIKELYNEICEKYDIVFTERINRNQNLFRQFFSTLYFKSFGLFSGSEYTKSNGSLVMFNKKVKENFLKLHDFERAYLPLLKWLGFTQSSILVEHNPRAYGSSSYSFLKLVNIAVQSWVSYSDKLLRYSIILGFIFSLFSVLYALYLVFNYFYNTALPGWTSLIVLILISTGVILISIGIVGLYVGKTFEQSKNRPLFIVSKSINYE